MRSVPNWLSILALVGLKALALAQNPAPLELVIQLGHTGSVTSVALSGDGKHLLTGSEDRTAILWDSATGKQLQTFSGHPSWVTSVAISADGKFVVVASANETLLWQAADGKKLQTIH